MNRDGFKILEYTDGLNLVICNILFMKQESKLGLLKVRLTILLYSSGTKLWFVTSRSFQMKNVCQSINCL